MQKVYFGLVQSQKKSWTYFNSEKINEIQCIYKLVRSRDYKGLESRYLTYGEGEKKILAKKVPLIVDQ